MVSHLDEDTFPRAFLGRFDDGLNALVFDVNGFVHPVCWFLRSFGAVLFDVEKTIGVGVENAGCQFLAQTVSGA